MQQLESVKTIAVIHQVTSFPIVRSSTLSESWSTMDTSRFGIRGQGWDPSDRMSFVGHLKSSTNILALLGAGLSAASGLATFRGAGSSWRQRESRSLASPWAFKRDPGLVWQFYEYRRQMALRAEPNSGHVALAELAKTKPGLLTIT